MSDPKLSPRQIAVLEKLLAAHKEGAKQSVFGLRSSYDLGESLATMWALHRRGLVYASGGAGSMFSPKTSILWRISAAGRLWLERNQP